MPRIVGIDIPNQKAMFIALTYVYGIGRHTAKDILREAKVDENTQAGKLTEDELSRITQIIERSYVVGGQLRRQVSQNIARLRDIGCYGRYRRNIRGTSPADGYHQRGA